MENELKKGLGPARRNKFVCVLCGVAFTEVRFVDHVRREEISYLHRAVRDFALPDGDPDKWGSPDSSMLSFRIFLDKMERELSTLKRVYDYAKKE